MTCLHTVPLLNWVSSACWEDSKWMICTCFEHVQIFKSLRLVAEVSHAFQIIIVKLSSATIWIISSASCSFFLFFLRLGPSLHFLQLAVNKFPPECFALKKLVINSAHNHKMSWDQCNRFTQAGYQRLLWDLVWLHVVVDLAEGRRSQKTTMYRCKTLLCLCSLLCTVSDV